jgi:hypothetical protein
MKGYTGAYGRVATFARKWRRAEQERLHTAGRDTFVPLVFAPGDRHETKKPRIAGLLCGG